MKQLAGIILCYDCIKGDYCYLEAIESLRGICNHTFIISPGDTDGTRQTLIDLVGQSKDLTLILNEEWDKHHGKEKLSILTNIGVDMAKKEGYEWQFVCQSDEILDPDSYPYILAAIAERPEDEGFLTNRVNLWGDSKHYLSCSPEKQPCSTQVIRLTKAGCPAVDDAESHMAQCKYFVDEIVLWHCGFIRDKYKMIGKVINMQEAVFGMDHDPALDKMRDGWDPWVSHSKDDVSPIRKNLPKLIQKWAEERDAINKKSDTLGVSGEW